MIGRCEKCGKQMLRYMGCVFADAADYVSGATKAVHLGYYCKRCEHYQPMPGYAHVKYKVPSSKSESIAKRYTNAPTSPKPVL